MAKEDTDPVLDDPEGDSGSLATSRSRRGPSRVKGRREEALAKLKAAKSKEWKYTVDEEMTDNVYEVVDEKKYAERVKERLEDDFIVDDDGEYADDGREIFDEDEDDEEDGKFAGPRKAAKAKKKAEEEEKRARKRGNIRNMLLNMPGKKKKAEEKSSGLKDDEVLESLLGEIKSSSKPALQRKPPPAKVVSGGQEYQRPLTTNTEGEKESLLGEIKSSSKPALQRKPPPAKVVSGGQEYQQATRSSAVNPTVEEFTDAELSSMMEEDFIDDASQPTADASEKVANRGFFEKKVQASVKPDLSNWICGQGDVFASSKEATDVQVEQGDLPLITNTEGEKVLRIFWLDAFEDPFKHPGTVWLFGKVFIEKARAYVSCCLTVKNIKRRVFLLKRDNRFDAKAKKEVEGEEVSMDDVYQEFNSKIAERYKIAEFRSKTSEKLYAFEYIDVPNKAEYLEVQYSSKFPALPSDLHGETFRRVFGANQSSLEHFLISRRIKGPCWLEVKLVTPSSPPTSWCKVEAICEEPNHISVLLSNASSPPPLTVLAMNMKTTINPKTMLTEIAVVSCLVHHEFYLDKASPKQPFQMHFCAMTKPSDEVWPFDLQKVMSQNNFPKVEKMDTERALLGFVLAKIGKIDPDIIIGHDITGFDLDILLHRTITNKIPHWSRLGRLKRSQPPNFRGRMAEKQALTGRLVCDLKISAKELIRCKSYDLGALVEKLLGKSVEERVEVGCEDMRKAYENSKALMHVANLSLQDAADILQCVYELNALPLALQITQVAGNVMSRTLLGGRAERNEFLLLHAFSERNYIFPDKQYGKKKVAAEEDEETNAGEAKGKTGRRKPAYAGGLVLEPKKGFYDKFILLMDFNSLYPSIIQEYNICFTTVNRKLPLNEKGTPNEDFIPEVPGSECELGILPTEIRKLVESRKVVKNLLKDPNISQDQRMQYDIRQKALKLTANSMYGCLGFSHSRFFAKPLAALITSRGREILLDTKSLVERMNLEVIYGDTDSIMVNTNSVEFSEVFKLGASIKQEVNKMYKLLELDVDGVYRYMLLLKKKKYAAVTMEMKGGQAIMTTELKGLDIVRRDWSQLAADAGKQILGKILSDCSADERVSFLHERLASLAEDLREGRIPLSDLAITKQLTKNPADYTDKKALPHVQVAMRMNSKGGRKLKAGDTVEYVICEDGSNLPATQRAYHMDEVRERAELKVDIQYYLAQQLHPVVSRLCDPLEGTDSSRIAQCLGLDPEQYRRSAVNEHLTAEEENGLREEDRFRECEKLKVTCECGEEVILESATRGSKDDRHLSLAKCPSGKSCDKRPIQRLAYIQNTLTLAIRRHLNRYYAGYISCEDPACSGRSRQLPLEFKGAFPVCSTCSKAIMVKEYSDKQLYTQLLYFQQLFDVSKAGARYGKNFNSDLVNVRDGQANYMLLRQQVDRVMDLNNYSIIDMTRLFSGFSTMKAARFRNGRNM